MRVEQKIKKVPLEEFNRSYRVPPVRTGALVLDEFRVEIDRWTYALLMSSVSGRFQQMTGVVLEDYEETHLSGGQVSMLCDLLLSAVRESKTLEMTYSIYPTSEERIVVVLTERFPDDGALELVSALVESVRTLLRVASSAWIIL